MTLGEKIEVYAKNNNISLRQLALESSINYNTLYAFVKRGGKTLTEESLRNVASALGISPEQLTSDEISIEERPSEATIALNLTISSIIGQLTGGEAERMLYTINTFLEEQAHLIKLMYRNTTKEEM